MTIRRDRLAALLALSLTFSPAALAQDSTPNALSGFSVEQLPPLGQPVMVVQEGEIKGKLIAAEAGELRLGVKKEVRVFTSLPYTEIPTDLPVGGKVKLAYVSTHTGKTWVAVTAGKETFYPLSNPPSESGDSSSEDCFLTTAVTRALGAADDGPELTLARQFRDTFMRAEASRSAEVDVYYQIAPGLVAAVQQRPDADAVWRLLWEDYLAPIRDLIEAGEQHAAHAAYRQMVLDLADGLGLAPSA